VERDDLVLDGSTELNAASEIRKNKEIFGQGPIYIKDD